ncbi:MAG: chemotaxis protein CheW [Pseudanabaenales cyanobacterium]|nr:chemotaxis protein CheW [Pseudanabaenales cyanobacterium]
MTIDALTVPTHSIPVPETDILVANEQFLRFRLEPDTTALLPIRQLTEVLKIPIGEIMPIPHMPTWVMGVYNWRGEILWMLDLGHLLGLTPWYQQTLSGSTYSAIVLHTEFNPPQNQPIGHQSLGLVVSRVEDIEWFDPGMIQSPLGSAGTTGLAPFLSGYWVKSDGEMLDVLDGNAIFDRMPRA